MRAAVAAAVAVLCVAGCGGSGGGSPRRDTRTSGSAPARRAPDDDALLRRMLGARSAALERGSARALAATSTGAQRRRDRVAARRARALGLRSVETTAEVIDVSGRRARLRSTTSYHVRGVAGAFESRRRMTAIRTRGGWRLRSVHGRRGRPPWEVDSFRRVRSRHFVVLAPPAVDPAAGGLLDALELGYARMRGLLRRGHLRRRYLVVVAADAARADRLTSAIRGLENLAALTDSEVTLHGPAQRVQRVRSQRLLIVWPALLALDAEQRVTVVTHELCHAVLTPFTSGRVPSWLVEGVALYVSDDRRFAEAADSIAMAQVGVVRRALSLARLSGPDAIAHLEGDPQSAAYAYASSTAFYIARHYGQHALPALYDAYNDEDLSGDAGSAALTDAAVRRVLGIGLERLETDVRDWIAAGAP